MSAIRAWYRFERAFEAAGRHLRETTGLTGEQVAMCRIVAERDEWSLGDLRARLSMHPATLGQALARLADRGLITVDNDPTDRRRRRVAVTEAGATALETAPLIGPVRLRQAVASAEELRAVRSGFDLAVELFGLQPWADDVTKEKGSDDE